ncbi:MAG: proline--tRNA ligase [Sulfolobales archaeon]|nr:proline--tRNA ligase [Sulfolobales archaeon]MCX8208895.1 proline--tRNA ligase [Sulfolobales archaeon]MDW8011193.1 proline--tRNA ligase [Sulfolobales archaeon]
MSIYRDLGKDFDEWFDWIVKEAEVYDYGRYPVKGMGVWLPYGFKIRKNVVELMRNLLDATGHEEVLLPLLIPDSILAKESEHVRGFEDQVYWVTHGGLTPLDVKLALRPTSETPLSYLESLWIKSYKQLPKKYYQFVSVFRYETAATRAMIRVREVSTFKEAHTLHSTFEDSERQVAEAVEIYSTFFRELGIPFVISKRPEWDKFPGAIYTIAYDTLMPDGRTLQIGTVHNLGRSFTIAFNVWIHMPDGTMDYGWQTSYGISERVVASLLSVHGDSTGLRLPFKYAPIQVVVVPIPTGPDEVRREVLNLCAKVLEELRAGGTRSLVDDREDMTPGDKFYYWERRGVPLRLEVGPREVQSKTVTVVRRDNRARISVKLEELTEAIKAVGSDYDNAIKSEATEAFSRHVVRARSLEEAGSLIEGNIVEVPWCGRVSCAMEMELKVGGRALGTPLKILDSDIGELKCAYCGDRARTFMRYSKRY